MAEWNPKANEVFLRAAELEAADERRAFLDSECGSDPALRRQVESLLAASAEAGSFLNEPAAPRHAGTIAYAPIREGPGAVIGPYKLRQKIGEGGFGVVYMAEQEEPLRRMVALKIIKPGMDTNEVIARFESERQALAIMDHPNIAKVLDAGATQSGRPYFVMELVKGVPITEFCDKNHMPAEQRLKLFIDVCHAIQHAHHKGVIHRDIKPSNVMVTLHDGVPVVKVIDFGVAKATVQRLTEKTLFTAYGQMVGTPAYMSPEQAEMSGLDIDTRTDTYSLGVLLYELLTGTTPLESNRLRDAGYAEMQRLIREEEPPRPSTRMSSLGESATIFAGNRGSDPKQLARLLAGDLDWIVMKALEKDRNRRYGTPGNFAEDIERYLKHEAILARPPSTTYKLGKFVRRNRATVLTGASVAAALLIGAAVATWQAVVATQAKQDALAALADAEGARQAEAQQRKRAEVNEQNATRAKKDALEALADAQKARQAEAQERKRAEANEQIARSEEKRAKASAAETRAVLDFVNKRIFAAARPEGKAGGLGHDVTLRRAIETALPFVEKSFANRPLIEARLRMTLALSFRYLGEAKIAVEQGERARTLYAKHRGPDHPDTLSSMDGLANSYRALGRLAEAVELHEQTLKIRKATLAPDHPATLRSMNNLANAYSNLGRYADALKLHKDVLDIRNAKFGPDDLETISSMGNLAKAYGNLGRHADALELHKKTLALQETNLGPNHPDTLSSMNGLAGTYHAIGRHADALKLSEKTLTLSKAKLGPDHPDTLGAMVNVAADYAALGRHADAVKLYEETLPIMQAKIPDHRFTANCMTNLAICYAGLGRHADALKLREQALALRKNNLGPDHPDTLSSMNGLAGTYHAIGRHADALKLSEKTLTLSKAKLGPDHPDTLGAMVNVASDYAALGRHADAVKLYEETLPIMQAKIPDHRFTANCMTSLAICYAGLGRRADALKLREQALALRKNNLGPDHPATLASMGHLASSLVELDRGAEALSLIDDCLRRAAGKDVNLSAVISARLMYFQKAKDAAGCQATAEMWEKRNRTDNASLYDAACCRAVTAAVLKEAPSADAPRLATQEADRAMAWLKQAVAAGYTNAAHMAKDRDLDALRERTDFQVLMAQLQGAQAKKKK